MPVAAATNPDQDKPSHLQQIHAELVSQLPVPDEEGGVHHTMPALTTNSDYKAYIRQRTAAWLASRQRNVAPAPNPAPNDETTLFELIGGRLSTRARYGVERIRSARDGEIVVSSDKWDRAINALLMRDVLSTSF